MGLRSITKTGNIGGVFHWSEIKDQWIFQVQFRNIMHHDRTSTAECEGSGEYVAKLLSQCPPGDQLLQSIPLLAGGGGHMENSLYLVLPSCHLIQIELQFAIVLSSGTLVNCYPQRSLEVDSGENSISSDCYFWRRPGYDLQNKICKFMRESGRLNYEAEYERNIV